MPIAGDETGIQSFVKAGDGPVTLQLLASYGPPREPVGINGWYPAGTGATRTTLFTIPLGQDKVLDPTIESGGTLSFDPGSTAFGFWNTWPYWGQYIVYQEDRLNTWDTGQGGVQHHMRVYPYRNPDGSLEPHAYVVTTEEAPISAGPDYNDIVYVVRNVSPSPTAGGALLIQNLDAFPAPDFAVFSTITTITNCYTPLTVKDTSVIRIRNMSGGPITVSSVGTTPEFMATPSVDPPQGPRLGRGARRHRPLRGHHRPALPEHAHHQLERPRRRHSHGRALRLPAGGSPVAARADAAGGGARPVRVRDHHRRPEAGHRQRGPAGDGRRRGAQLRTG